MARRNHFERTDVFASEEARLVKGFNTIYFKHLASGRHKPAS